MVIAAGRNECRAGIHALHQLKPEHAAIKRQRAIEIGHLEMDMTDPCACDDGCGGFGHGCLLGHAASELSCPGRCAARKRCAADPGPSCSTSSGSRLCGAA